MEYAVNRSGSIAARRLLREAARYARDRVTNEGERRVRACEAAEARYRRTGSRIDKRRMQLAQAECQLFLDNSDSLGRCIDAKLDRLRDE